MEVAEKGIDCESQAIFGLWATNHFLTKTTIFHHQQVNFVK